MLKKNNQSHGQHANSSRNAQAANQTIHQDNFTSSNANGATETQNDGDPLTSTSGNKQENQGLSESGAAPSENQARAGPNLDPGRAQNNTSDNAQGIFRTNSESTRINVKVKHNTTDQLFAVQQTMNLIDFKRYFIRAHTLLKI